MNSNIDGIRLWNRKRFPLEELGKLAGNHVAWSGDNAKVLVASPDLDFVYAELERQGITDYIMEYIPDTFWA